MTATGRSTLEDALEWIADDRALTAGTDRHTLLRAIAALGERRGAALDAARHLARQVTASELDTAAVLLEPETITPADKFRSSLDLLARRSPDHSLARINASTVIAAHTEDSFVIEALCAVAGLSYGDLVSRVPSALPADPAGNWTPAQARAAFAVLDEIVRDQVKIGLPGAVATRPLELMPAVAGPLARSGWEAVEQMHRGGIPYDILLAQRAAGGAWLAHRNRTAGKIASSIADQLCLDLDQRGMRYRRATGIGGQVSPSVMRELSDAGRQLGLLALDGRDHPAYGVVFAVARDSGTASKSAARLRTMARGGRVPIALLLAGAGWAARNETAELALDFEGRVFSDRAIGALVDEIQDVISRERHEGDTR